MPSITVAISFIAKFEVSEKQIIASNTVDLRAKSKDINTALGGKGGGSSIMIQGSCTAKREDIEAVKKDTSIAGQQKLAELMEELTERQEELEKAKWHEPF